MIAAEAARLKSAVTHIAYGDTLSRFVTEDHFSHGIRRRLPALAAIACCVGRST